jgi:hypothetical protein
MASSKSLRITLEDYDVFRAPNGGSSNVMAAIRTIRQLTGFGKGNYR